MPAFHEGAARHLRHGPDDHPAGDLHALPDPRRARGWRRGGWRCCRSVLLAMLAYGLKLIDRGRLKEINYILLIGRGVAPERLEPVVESFADAPARRPTSCPAPARAIAADRAAGRRLVMATASYRLYAAAIARRLGFDDVIATDTGLDARGRILARIDGRQLLRRRQARHDRGLAAARGAGARGGPHPLLFRPCLRRPSPPLVRRAGRRQPPRPAGPAGRGGRLGSASDWSGPAERSPVTPAKAGVSTEDTALRRSPGFAGMTRPCARHTAPAPGRSRRSGRRHPRPRSRSAPGCR